MATVILSYTSSMWDIETTDEFARWYRALTPRQAAVVTDRVDLLEQEGPRLRRPYVGEIRSSQFSPRMKELVCEASGESLRVLFIFDPHRSAILLLGGNKTGAWNDWYKTAVPAADDLYKAHLRELRESADQSKG